MAIAVDASSPASVTSSTTTATTASFTPAASSLLIAICSIGNSSGSGLVTGTVTDSLGGTWNIIKRTNATSGGATELWVQDIGSSPAARTVTLTGSGTNGKGLALVVHCLTGARAYSSGDGQFTGAYTNAVSGSGANLTAASLGSGSLYYYAMAYNTSAVTWTPRSDNTALANFTDSTNGEAFYISRLTALSTQGTSSSMGTTTTGLTGVPVQMLVEIVAAPSSLKNTRVSLSLGTVTGLTGAAAGTKWEAGLALRSAWVNNTFTYVNKNTVTGPTAPIQATDSATVGTDGTVVSWYTRPLKAVTIAGQIVASVFARWSNASAAAGISFRVDRCSNDGTVVSNIVDQATNQGGGTIGTTASGGNQKTITIAAAATTDTTLVDGDRLRIQVYFDDASDQGGAGTMASGFSCQMSVGAYQAGVAGDSRFVFTESLEEYIGAAAQSWAGSGAALALSAGTGTLDPSGSASITGSSSALVLSAGSGSTGGSGIASITGSGAALVLTAPSGSLANDTTFWQGSGASIALGASGGALTGTGTASWSGGTRALVLTAGTGSLVAGAQFWSGSSAALALTAPSGALTPTTAPWVGSSAALALAAPSGSLSASGAASLVGSGAALVLIARTGALTPGTAAWAGTAAALALVAGSGSFGTYSPLGDVTFPLADASLDSARRTSADAARTAASLDSTRTSTSASTGRTAAAAGTSRRTGGS